MKHVFFVHSHITYLVSCGVIRHAKLEAAKVLFVCARGYAPPPGPYARVDFREPPFTLRPLQRWRHRRALARFVDSVATEDFLWYLPHTATATFGAFVGHRLCRGFSLIEEGIASYLAPTEIDEALRHVVGSRTGWRRWPARLLVALRPPVFADPRYLAAYGCTEEAFPGYARRVKVDIAGAPPPGAPVDAVVVFDAVLEASLVDEESFFVVLEDLLERLAADNRRVASYKLHPLQYIDDRFTPRLRKALEDNRHGLVLHELPADYCLELLALGGRTDFYIFSSSVGIYAAEYGCRVVSIAPRLAAADARYRRLLDAIPDGVRRRMQML